MSCLENLSHLDFEELCRDLAFAETGERFSAFGPGPDGGTAHASEQQRSEVLRRRRAWFETQPDLDPGKLVFVDETGASTKMA